MYHILNSNYPLYSKPEILNRNIRTFIIHTCDPTVVICYLIWLCDITVCITYLISHTSSSLSYTTVIKGYFRLGV